MHSLQPSCNHLKSWELLVSGIPRVSLARTLIFRLTRVVVDFNQVPQKQGGMQSGNTFLC